MKKKRRTRRRDRPSATARGIETRPLNKKETLERVPPGTDETLLTTRQLQHIFNDCHVQTIYKMIGRGELRPYRTRSRGKMNVYKRGEVIAAIHSRFRLMPAEGDRTHGSQDDEASAVRTKPRKSARRSKAS